MPTHLLPIAVTGVVPTSSETPGEPVLGDAPDDASEALEVILDTVEALWTGFLANLPLILVGLVVVVLGVLVSGRIASGLARGLTRTRADEMVVSLTSRLLRIGIVAAFVLLALSVAGVNVGAAMATLGIAGFAVAFALQNILENFVAGVLLLMRKPFRAGDQIRTGDHEGTVEDIDLRVTKIIDYDGELVLVPNAEVYKNALINLTRRGKRRTRVHIGVDYRDDHDAAREVIRDAVSGTKGVIDDPPVQVLLLELGESSVNFEVRYWTRPDIASVLDAQDRVLSAAKSALTREGFTIPWPIRTLVVDPDSRPAWESREGF